MGSRVTGPAVHRPFLALGASNAFLAVAMGAFGAHALQGRLAPGLAEVWQTAVEYHLAHALGLVLLSLLCAALPGCVRVRWSGVLMVLGIALFSGSLYLMALTGERWLGAVTPFGGGAFLAAWALLTTAAWCEASG